MSELSEYLNLDEVDYSLDGALNLYCSPETGNSDGDIEISKICLDDLFPSHFVNEPWAETFVNTYTGPLIIEDVSKCNTSSGRDCSNILKPHNSIEDEAAIDPELMDHYLLSDMKLYQDPVVVLTPMSVEESPTNKHSNYHMTLRTRAKRKTTICCLNRLMHCFTCNANITMAFNNAMLRKRERRHRKDKRRRIRSSENRKSVKFESHIEHIISNDWWLQRQPVVVLTEIDWRLQPQLRVVLTDILLEDLCGSNKKNYMSQYLQTVAEIEKTNRKERREAFAESKLNRSVVAVKAIVLECNICFLQFNDNDNFLMHKRDQHNEYEYIHYIL